MNSFATREEWEFYHQQHGVLRQAESEITKKVNFASTTKVHILTVTATYRASRLNRV